MFPTFAWPNHTVSQPAGLFLALKDPFQGHAEVPFLHENILCPAWLFLPECITPEYIMKTHTLETFQKKCNFHLFKFQNIFSLG